MLISQSVLFRAAVEASVFELRPRYGQMMTIVDREPFSETIDGSAVCVHIWLGTSGCFEIGPVDVTRDWRWTR